MLISIIVPVYNVEVYLRRCVESIINQTYHNIEIILVNDGSTDGCKELCESYKKKDSRIKVINKLNGGLSDARNIGLKAASGEYVMFVDSDDYIEFTACSELISELKGTNSDIIYANSIWHINNNKKIVKRNNLNEGTIYSGREVLKKELQAGSCSMQAWLGLYRREFLVNNNLYFKRGIFHEDEQWTPRVLLVADSIKYKDFIFYHYIIRNNSITQQQDKTKNAIDLVEIAYELSARIDELEDKELRDLLNRNILKLFLGGIYTAYKYGDMNKVNIKKGFVRGKSLTLKDKIRVLLFLVNTKLYCITHNYLVNRRTET